MCEANVGEFVFARRAKPTPVASANEQGSPHGWREITVLLELLQDSCSSSVTDYYLLTPHFFNLLSRCVSYSPFSLPLFISSSLYRCLQSEDSERPQLEYTQQLLLGALLSICDQLTQQGIEEARGTHTHSLREHSMCYCYSLLLSSDA